MHKKNVVLSLLVGFVLTACGGGGSSTSSSSSSSGGGTEMVSSTTPTDSASSVNKTSTVSATFSENMLGTSIDNSSFTLANTGLAIPSSVSFDGANNVATLTPNNLLGPLQTYTASLDNTITNLLGDKLLETNWSFITAEGSWGTIENIALTASFASLPQIEFDESGNAVAIWGYPTIYANRYVSGTGWGTAEAIDKGSDLRENSALAVNQKGNAIAAWRTRNSNTLTVDVNVFTAGTGWGTAQTIHTGTTTATPTGSHFSAVAMDNNGNAFLIWNHFDGTTNTVYAKRYVEASGWGAIQTLYSGAANFHVPKLDVVIDSNGNAIAMWETYDGTDFIIYTNRYTAGMGWGTTQQVAIGENPDLAINSNDEVFATWDITGYIQANRYASGSGWGSPVNISSQSSGAEDPRVSVDSNGNAMVVWYLVDNASNQDIAANRYVNGTGWETEQIINASTDSAKFPQVALDNHGNAIAVWEEHDGSKLSVYTNRYISGSGWGTVVTLDSISGYATDPKVVMDKNGKTIAIWNSSSGAYVNRFE